MSLVQPPGPVLSTCLYQTFAHGASVAAAGGRLTCQVPGDHDPADGPPACTACMLASVAVIPDRPCSESIDVFALTTAMCDADGRMWQRTRHVTVWELWEPLCKQPRLYPQAVRLADQPIYRNAETVSCRELLSPIETMNDAREHHLFEVIRERPDASAPAPQLPYERFESLVFRLSFKYFGARIGLREEVATRKHATTGQPVDTHPSLVLTVQPITDASLLVALNEKDEVVKKPGVSLLDLGTLRSERFSLQPGWEKPCNYPAVPAGRDVWERALSEVGGTKLTARALQPNPMMRFESN